MDERELDKPTRRNLLKGLFVGAAAATTAGLTSGVAQAAQPETEEETAGYRETDHVRRYYVLAGR